VNILSLAGSGFLLVISSLAQCCEAGHFAGTMSLMKTNGNPGMACNVLFLSTLSMNFDINTKSAFYSPLPMPLLRLAHPHLNVQSQRIGMKSLLSYLGKTPS
jgi:hypothetical protein